MKNLIKNKKILHILIFPFTLIYCEFILKAFSGIAIFPHIFYPVLFGIGAGLFFSFVTALFSDKVKWILNSVLLSVTGILFIVECLIYRSFQFYMPIGAISSVTSDVTGDYMQTLVQAVLIGIPIIALFLLPAILYFIFGKKYLFSEKMEIKKALIVLAGAFLFTGLGVLIANSGNISSKYRGEYQFNIATQHFGLVSSLELDAYYGIFGNSAADAFLAVEEEVLEEMTEETMEETSLPEEDMSEDILVEGVVEEIVYDKNEMDLPLDEISASTSSETIISMNEYVKSLSASSQNEYTGLFEGENLIMICAEAFSHAAIIEELTPTLYRLAHNGFYFSDYYQPSWNGSTSTGEYSMLMGIAPLMDVRTMPATEGKNLYFTMGNQLQRLGYTGNAFHNGGYTYYSRNLTHQNLGYDEYIAQGSGLEKLASAWPSDSEMFEGTIPTYIDNQPFSVYYMTVSGHFPYKSDSEKVKEYIDYVRSVVGDEYKDKTLYYLCYQMELEESLTRLVEQLEEKGIADDTVICITADHYPYGLEHSSTYGNTEDYIEDLYGYYPETDWERDKNAWILWSGCLENEYKDMACEISEPTYSLDILPTLSNLFGLEYDSRLLVGRDVFSDETPLALWVNHSWVTTAGKYDAATDTFYPNEGMAVSERYIAQMKKIVANKLSFSGKILDYDYYNVLLGDDK